MKEFEVSRQLAVLKENVEKVRARIAAACERGQRNTSEVTLIAVSKNFPAKAVRMAVECGLRDFGENRVQEAYAKYLELSDVRSSLRLHFIGHLQTNKVKEALAICDVIHSVDSLRLAQTIDERTTRKIPVLLQVNVAKEETKYGFAGEDVNVAVKAVRALQNIDLIGLMTIAPAVGDPEEVRPFFSRLREMNKTYGLKELSMGMTDDFEVAIEEGSTMVRVGPGNIWRKELNMKIAMIGGGTMGEALVKSLLRKKVAAKGDITFSDVIPARLESLNKKYGTKIAENNVIAVKDAGIVVLAIKPQDLGHVLESLAGHVKSKLVISIAAGISLSAICSKLNYSHVVRAMPNTPAQVGRGMTAWTAAKEVSKQELEAARTILSSTGEQQYFADEKYIDMATAISGSGPAYVFLFIESLIDAGVHIGLPRPMAEKLAVETIVGSAEAMKKTGKHPAELKNMVTSPGGTTAEALLRFEEGGLRPMVINAVIAAYNKAKSLGAK